MFPLVYCCPNFFLSDSDKCDNTRQRACSHTLGEADVAIIWLSPRSKTYGLHFCAKTVYEKLKHVFGVSLKVD